MNALEIYEQAQQISDPESRRVFLDAACAGDANLRRRVAAMLGITVVPETFLGKPLVDRRSGTTSEGGDSATAGVSGRSAITDPLLGAVIGGVRLERLVGQGGMGKVYAGTQASTGGTVAVKVLMPHVVSDGMLKRFEQEARLLGRLRHPGIAQIYTAGTFAGGDVTLPYFVMEYIAEAQPITDYAEANNLSTTQRLELFRKACEAVAHGHEHGVIHRDLKPANMLVDRFGQPKVIDFGVAKCTDADVTMTTLTADGGMVGTLKYMSPEQASGDQDAITVRSDVHALGVILYELLARQMPFDFANALPIGVAQVIKTQDPKPLSSVSRAFRGDLDAITAKCLEKDRHHRYASAAELNAELGRYLSGEAILTRPVGFIGGLLRLFRKHKAAAAAITGVAASLVAAVVGVSVFAVRAERAREEAAQARSAEADQRRTAQAESQRAKRRLYQAKLSNIVQSRRLAGALLREAQAAYVDAYGSPAHTAPELAYLASNINQSMESLALLQGHKESVISLAYSPDGTRLATGSDDSTARIWDAESGQSLAILTGHTGPIGSIAFSPDGRLLVTASSDIVAKDVGDPSPRIWDAATGKLLSVLQGHTEPVTAIMFSPDGSRLATVSRDNTAKLWDVTSRRPVAVLEPAEAPIAFSPDGSQLATYDGKNSITLWNADTGQSIGDFQDTDPGFWGGAFLCLAFSPDGKRLASGTFEGRIHIWDVATNKSLAVVEGEPDMIMSLAFSPDGARLATAGAETRISDGVTGQPSSLLEGHTGPVYSLAYSKDGTRLATASDDTTVRVWDALTGESLTVLQGHDSEVTCVAFSPDGERLATGSADATARVWDTSGSRLSGVLTTSADEVTSAAVSPDGTRLVTGHDDATVRIWNTATVQPVAKLKQDRQSILCLALSPDGQHLATGSTDRKVRIWDTATGESSLVPSRPGWLIGTPECVAFSADSSRLAAGWSKDVCVWDTATGKSLAILKGHKKVVTCVAFSPNGRFLATGSGDETVRLWDVDRQTEHAVLNRHGSGIIRSIESLAFSPDGSRLATLSGDKSVRLWDPDNGNLRRILEGHSGSVSCLAFSPDGTWVATGSLDLTARIWEAATGVEVAVLKGHEGGIHSIVFSPDGQRLVTVAEDATARIWDPSIAETLVVLKGFSDRVSRGRRFSPFVSFVAEEPHLITCSEHGASRIWGLSNTEMYRNRLASAERRTRLGPLLDDWFSGDLAAVKSRLAAERTTLPPDDWHEASDMVLERASKLSHATGQAQSK